MTHINAGNSTVHVTVLLNDLNTEITRGNKKRQNTAFNEDPTADEPEHRGSAFDILL